MGNVCRVKFHDNSHGNLTEFTGTEMMLFGDQFDAEMRKDVVEITMDTLDRATKVAPQTDAKAL
jgi:hypothetical protein